MSRKVKKEDNIELCWTGKQEMLDSLNSETDKKLIECKEESKDFDTTNNMYIEGDNLEALKLLQKDYNSKIKMIYIDPPYNTRKNFVYKDNMTHSDWLNMMYPRLKLARNLLKDDGVMFISIDDNEQANLKKLCDEVFGEENFVGDIIRKTKSTTNDNKTGLNIQHENTLVYAKTKSNLVFQGEEKTFENYKNPDNDPSGAWVIADPSARTGSYFEIKNPHTGKVDLPPENRQWLFSEKSFLEYIKTGKLKFRENHKPNERGFIFKRYKNEVRSDFSLVDSLFGADNKFMNQAGTKHINKLFPEFKAFDYTKPVEYILKLIQYTITTPGSIILDFFAGSGTTAHAVMQLNAEDNGNRRFIMVQLPEICDEKTEAFKQGYKNICEIGKERIRRAGERMVSNIDKGFKVYKIINKE